MISPQSHNKDTLIVNSSAKDSKNSNNIEPINKGELKKVEQDITVAKNRLATLRQQLQKQKDAIKKNKALTEEVLAKKVAVNMINSYKLKDNSDDLARIENLKKRNLSMRLQHERSLQNIQKAIYLVKLDDAREVKIISEEHKRRIREMQSQSVNKRIEKKKILQEESKRAKDRYMQYWRQKLASIYAEQAQSAQDVIKSKQEKQKQLKQLQQEEIKLLQQINSFHSKNIQTKKQYVAALSLPVKDVAEAMGNNTIQNSRVSQYQRSKSFGEIQHKTIHKNKLNGSIMIENSSNPNFGPKIKVPNASVNQTKLKIILQQLKKLDKKRARYQDQKQDNGPYQN